MEAINYVSTAHKLKFPKYKLDLTKSKLYLGISVCRSHYRFITKAYCISYTTCISFLPRASASSIVEASL